MARIIPLKALQAFEVAGRHQSIKKAADELCVTTGAISQQIKILEDYLDLQLFVRMNKSVKLTDVGKKCLPLLSQGFERLHEAVEIANSFKDEKIVSVTVSPAFGFKWLMPRLDKFQNSYPEIDLKIDTSTRMVDFLHEDIDLAIRYGPLPKSEKGLHVEPLAQEEIFPVCNPMLLSEEQQINPGLELLNQYPLIHLEGRASDRDFPDWNRWFEHHNDQQQPEAQSLTFNSSSMVLQAAIDGHGVALGSSVLAAADLDAGRLIRISNDNMNTLYSYYLICAQATYEKEEIKQFIGWLTEEMSLPIAHGDPA
ncbi:MAG: transcriptional regulator GcvA [Neptuniibacter sp.]